MKTKEIREMSTEEINAKIESTRKEIFDMRMKQATATLEKPHRLREARKDIARMKTVLTERQKVSEGGKQ